MVIGEYRVEESWTKLFKLGQSLAFSVPLRYCKNGRYFYNMGI